MKSMIHRRFGRVTLMMAFTTLVAGVVALSVRAQVTPPTTQPGGDGARQPQIITNQFNTTSGGSLAERRPGLMIQQAIALNQGTNTESLTGDIPPGDTFFKDTFYLMFEALIDGISAFLETLNLAGSLGGFDLGSFGGGGTSSTTMTTIPNSTTTGQGGTTTIP